MQKLSHETYISDNSYLLPVLTGFLFQHEYNEMINNETDIEMEFVSTECVVIFDYGIWRKLINLLKLLGLQIFKTNVQMNITLLTIYQI